VLNATVFGQNIWYSR